MRNKGRLVRMFFALGLILSLGVAPGLGVHAQQAAQKQAAPRAEVAAEKSAKAAAEKEQPSAEDEPLPLSDAEMEKVEGGIAWAVVIAAAGLGLAAYNTFRPRHNPAPAPRGGTNVTVYCGRR